MTVVDLIEKYPKIHGNKKGSFADYTLTVRLPGIIDQVVRRQPADSPQVLNLLRLKENVLHGNPDIFLEKEILEPVWTQGLEKYKGISWRALPFYEAEALFYHLLLRAVGYFELHADPFQAIKQHDIEVNRMAICNLLVTQTGQPHGGDQVRQLLYLVLWGNKADLSQQHQHNTPKNAQKSMTIIDDSTVIARKITGGLKRLDIILDNAGIELLTDLLFAVEMLKAGYVDKVVLHSKAYPTFVSDATHNDIDKLINYVVQQNTPACRSFSWIFNDYLAKNSIVIQPHTFWNSPLFFYQMPEGLRRDLSKSNLLICKGDANYRRIFGDRLFPVHLSPKTMADYLPIPTACIRILKSETILGVPREMAAKLDAEDANWKIHGNYGIIQVVN